MSERQSELTRMIRAQKRPDHLYGVALISPLVRLRDMGGGEWLMAALLSLAGLIWGELTMRVLLVLILSGAWDYYVGRGTAKRRQEFSPVLAHAGVVGKASGIVLVLLVFLLEAALAPHVDTRHLPSLALALGLVIVDLESIHDHRVKAGIAPIPLFGDVIEFLKRIAGRFKGGNDA